MPWRRAAPDPEPTPHAIKRNRSGQDATTSVNSRQYGAATSLTVTQLAALRSPTPSLLCPIYPLCPACPSSHTLPFRQRSVRLNPLTADNRGDGVGLSPSTSGPGLLFHRHKGCNPEPVRGCRPSGRVQAWPPGGPDGLSKDNPVKSLASHWVAEECLDERNGGIHIPSIKEASHAGRQRHIPAHA